MGSGEDVKPETIDDFLKIPDAAKFLGKSGTTIRSYMRSGILRGRCFKGSGRRRWVSRHDLEALKEMEHDIRLGGASIRELLKGIRIKLHAIDRRLDFLMHVNGLDISTLRDMDTDTLIRLYDEVSDFLELNLDRVPPPQIRQWAHILMQITELELDRLVGPCQDLEPWKPFHEMCQRMLISLRTRKRFGVDGTMQETYRLLDKARKSLGQAIVVFTEKHASEIGPRKRSRLFAIEARMDSLDRYIAEEVGNPEI